MRVLVVGAAGRTGRLLVEQALGHGHEVIGLARTGDLGMTHPRLTSIAGDAREFDTIDSAMSAVTGVAVTIDSSDGAKVHETVIANVVHAMAVHGASRLAVLSAAGAFARSDRHLSLAFRALIATSMRATYDDLEAMERRVMASDLDWTIVRPVGLSDAAPSGHYRLSLDGSIPPKVARVSRADVAAVLLKALETGTFRRRAVVVAQ